MLEQFANIIPPTSLAKLFYTYDNVVGNNVIYIVRDENYLCLINLGVLAEQDDIITDTGVIPAFSMPKEERYLALREMVLREPWCIELLDAIGDDGVKEDQLPSLSSYDEEQVSKMIWWLDNLNIITKSDAMYVPVDEESEEPQEDETYEGALLIGDITLKEDKYSVFDYLRKIERSKINLNPDFQRSLVWTQKQKSKFIESVILDIPLPPIYMKRDEVNALIMVDGLQRTACLRDFFAGKFALTGLVMLKKLNDCDINELQRKYPQYNTRLEDKQLQTYIISPSVKMEVIYDIFERINTGGTKLERQEMRNCIYAGKATRLLKEISETGSFRTAIDNGIMPTRMKDREAILRCLAFVLRDYEKEYTGSMDEFLSDAMRMLNKKTDEQIVDIKEKTLRIFRWAYELYGRHNFRLPTAHTRGRISIAVMETFFYVLWHMSKDDFIHHLTELRAIRDDIFDNPDYLVAVKYSTNSKNRVDARFSILKNRVNEILQS